jgi:hypothetical protein
MWNGNAPSASPSFTTGVQSSGEHVTMKVMKTARRTIFFVRVSLEASQAERCLQRSALIDGLPTHSTIIDGSSARAANASLTHKSPTAASSLPA